MQGFIELPKLENVLKSGELKALLRRSRRYYFWNDFGIFQSRVKTQVFRISKCGVRQRIFIAREITYIKFRKAIALLKRTSNQLWKMTFWQTALVGYMLPRLRRRRSLFRENWGGDHCRGRSIMFCKWLVVNKTILQKNDQFDLKLLAKFSDQKN